MDVELQIDELILDGVAPADRARVATAVQRELIRLFVERGVPPSWMQDGEIGRLDGGRYDATPGATADATGARIAQALYTGMSAPARAPMADGGQQP